MSKAMGRFANMKLGASSPDYLAARAFRAGLVPAYMQEKYRAHLPEDGETVGLCACVASRKRGIGGCHGWRAPDPATVFACHECSSRWVTSRLAGVRARDKLVLAIARRMPFGPSEKPLFVIHDFYVAELPS